MQWEQQKMKVKHAVQTLSASEADALVFCEQALKLPEFQGCTATVDFISTVDRLFDFLNSRNPTGHGFIAPLHQTEVTQWNLLRRAARVGHRTAENESETCSANFECFVQGSQVSN